jgi:IclR family acetate operon transcriptional repressor
MGSRRLARFTPNTITDPDMLLQHLALVRERGYALDEEESRIGVRCVGFPVFDRFGTVIAAVSVTGPAFRFTRARIAELEPRVLAMSTRISASLGYLGG